MKTIDITTTQNVTIEYELASLRDRFFAFFIDIMIIGVIYIILLLGLLPILTGIAESSEGLILRFFSLMPIALYIFYHFLSELFSNGQSLGKKALGIKVVRADGKEANSSDYLLRAIFHILETILSFGVVAAMLISASVKSQRLGDMTANTVVIRVRQNIRFNLEDILKISSIEDYEPAYPEVKQLSERDMLLIKTIISRYLKYGNEAHRKIVNELVSRLREQLDIVEQPRDPIVFLKTLIRDYIVLTR